MLPVKVIKTSPIAYAPPVLIGSAKEAYRYLSISPCDPKKAHIYYGVLASWYKDYFKGLKNLLEKTPEYIKVKEVVNACIFSIPLRQSEGGSATVLDPIAGRLDNKFTLEVQVANPRVQVFIEHGGYACAHNAWGPSDVMLAGSLLLMEFHNEGLVHAEQGASMIWARDQKKRHQFPKVKLSRDSRCGGWTHQELWHKGSQLELKAAFHIAGEEIEEDSHPWVISMRERTQLESYVNPMKSQERCLMPHRILEKVSRVLRKSDNSKAEEERKDKTKGRL